MTNLKISFAVVATFCIYSLPVWRFTVEITEMAPTPSTNLQSYIASDPVLASIEKFMYECENMTNHQLFVSKGKIFDSDADLLNILGPEDVTTNKKQLSARTSQKAVVKPSKRKIDSATNTETVKKCKTYESNSKKKTDSKKRGRPRKDKTEPGNKTESGKTQPNLELKTADVNRIEFVEECRPLRQHLKKPVHPPIVRQTVGANLVPVVYKHRVESVVGKIIDLTNNEDIIGEPKVSVEIMSEKQCVNEILHLLYKVYMIYDASDKIAAVMEQTYDCMSPQEKQEDQFLPINYKSRKTATLGRSLIDTLSRMSIRHFSLERFSRIICMKLDQTYKVKVTEHFVCNDLLFNLLNPNSTDCNNQLVKELITQLRLYKESKTIKSERSNEVSSDVVITKSQMEELFSQIRFFNILLEETTRMTVQAPILQQCNEETFATQPNTQILPEMWQPPNMESSVVMDMEVKQELLDTYLETPPALGLGMKIENGNDVVIID